MLSKYITAASQLLSPTSSFILHAILIFFAFASVILYVYAMAEWLPKLLYKKKRGADMLFETGKTKFDYPMGRSLICEPKGESREYLNKYMLYTDEDKKYVKCVFAPSVETIRFELSLYDVSNKLVRAEDVYAKVDGRIYSDGYLLPDDTYYVNFAVTEVNGKAITPTEEGREGVTKKAKKASALYSLLTVAVTLAEGTGLISLVKVLDFYFANGSYVTPADFFGDFAVVIVAVACALIGAVSALIGIKLHLKKK